jgi:hypothetical protein
LTPKVFVFSPQLVEFSFQFLNPSSGYLTEFLAFIELDGARLFLFFTHSRNRRTGRGRWAICREGECGEGNGHVDKLRDKVQGGRRATLADDRTSLLSRVVITCSVNIGSHESLGLRNLTSRRYRLGTSVATM